MDYIQSCGLEQVFVSLLQGRSHILFHRLTVVIRFVWLQREFVVLIYSEKLLC